MGTKKRKETDRRRAQGGRNRKGGGDFAASHQRERFVFTNNTGGDVNDLHVEFDVEGVRTSDMGGFTRATTEGKVVKLEGFTIPSGRNSRPEFERDGAFRIVKWKWTLDGQTAGQEQVGPP